MKSNTYFLKPLMWGFVFLLVFQSCKDKEEDTPPTLSANAKVNTWIKEVMDEVYYWLEDMRNPISLESDPEDYFESLLNRPTDRFSAIYPDYQELINSLQGTSKEAGYEFLLARESSTNNNVVAFVAYIKKGSPAESKGLKRGDLITQINGVRITLDNYQDILSKLDEPHSISYFRYNSANDSYEAQLPIDLVPVVFSENPNFLDSIYTVNGEKIGYFVYHFFNPGIEGQPTLYDDQMDAIFARFKSEGIRHLIVDLRYNGGGLEPSTINLGSLIAPSVTTTDIFFKRKANSFLMQFPEFQNMSKPFKTKTQNLGSSLSGNRVYIITSRRTASASELIINGLKPYMDVYLVGDVTVGKNVGSIVIVDEENPDNKYGLLPIVLQSFNKNDQSDYSNGFQPNFSGIELSQRTLLPFGDTKEYLLNIALNQISPGSFPSARMQFVERTDLGSTLDAHPRAGRLIIEHDFLKK
jgi:carboxyl-terminal processing protease